MIIFDGRTHFPCHTIMPKIDDIGKFIYFKFNSQQSNSIGDKICVGNFRFFYFDHSGKQELYFIRKKILYIKTIICSFHLIHYNKLEEQGFGL